MSGDARREQLLDLAEELFTKRGYEGVSLEDIARAADVTRPVVYRHFDGKDAMFVACVQRARAQFETRLLEAVGAVASEDLGDLIEAGGRVFYEMLAADPRRWALLFATSSAIEGRLSEQLAELRTGTINAIAELCAPYAPGIAALDIAALAHAISGIGEQLGRWWIRNPELTTEDILNRYRRLAGGCVAATLQQLDPA